MRGDMDELNAAAVDYLMFAGYVTLAYFWSRTAIVAEEAMQKEGAQVDFYQAKIEMADFYYQRLMPRADALVESIGNGAESLMAMHEDRFIFLDV